MSCISRKFTLALLALDNVPGKTALALEVAFPATWAYAPDIIGLAEKFDFLLHGLLIQLLDERIVGRACTNHLYLVVVLDVVKSETPLLELTVLGLLQNSQAIGRLDRRNQK